jgi:outer membrane scaffolding protein for murein synthesis (MipA/OmpV family)
MGAGEPIHGIFALGPGVAPEFEGSADAVPIPYAFAFLSWGGFGADLKGRELRVDASPWRGGWRAGPLLRFRPARDDEVEDKVVRRLQEVDAAVELGGFLDYGFEDILVPRDHLALGATLAGDAADAHGGAFGTLYAEYRAALSQRLRWSGGLSLSLSADAYAHAYFSVGAADAARSGLPPYEADAGLNAVGTEVTVLYAVTPSWSLGAGAVYYRLLGDAADSPIVRERGSPNQWIGGLFAAYAF